MRKMKREKPCFQGPVVNGKLLYEDLGYITNQHRIEWLRITAMGVTSHSSVHLADSTRRLSPRSLVAVV